jgi:hypothetical protein
MKIILCLILCLSPVLGKTFSLMHPEYNQDKDDSALTLNGIVFVSDKQWVVWINHQRITPDKIPNWLKILKITETYIQCEYLYNKLWYQVTLEPYDTFTPSIKTDDPST